MRFKGLSFGGAAAVILAFSVPAFSQGKVDHYKVYALNPTFTKIAVKLADNFNTETVTLSELGGLGHPVDKNREGIIAPNAYLSVYVFKPKTVHGGKIKFKDQFGIQTWKLGHADFLLVPTEKIKTGSKPPPATLDHYKCYEASGNRLDKKVSLRDEYDGKTAKTVTVEQPCFWCNPATKTHGTKTFKINNPKQYLACYLIKPQTRFSPPKLERTKDQFGTHKMVVMFPNLLCVPATKEGEPTRNVTLVEMVAERVASGIRVTWRTGAETQCGSFRVLRCEGAGCETSLAARWSEAGRVACEDSPGGARYAITDRAARPGEMYSYLLREHETTGRTNDYGPVRIGATQARAVFRGGAPGPAGGEVNAPDEGAVGCATAPGAGGAALPLLLLVALGAIRRRRA